MVKINWGRALLFLVLALFLFSVLFPFYWMLRSSMMTFSELFAFPPRFLPKRFNLDAYKEVLFEHGFLKYLQNSALVSITTVILTTTLATIGAYAVARLKFPGRSFMLRGILLVYMFPGILLIIPLFVMFSKVKLIDNLGGLIVAYLCQTLPVALYMLASYFRTVPEEIEEASLIDGCSRLEVIWRITLPLSTPAIASVAMYVFMIAWNEFLFAFVFLSTQAKFTMPIGLTFLYRSFHTAWDMVMAASTLISVPVIALFLFFERQLEAGLVAGGVKG